MNDDELLADVAKAIARVQLNGADPDTPAVRWNGTQAEPQDFPYWHDFRDEARAAIEAMRLLSRPPVEGKGEPLLAVYRDIFAEITAKAVPITDPTSADPDYVRGYRIPVGPIHRAAGKLGFQMFDGEKHLADALARIRKLEAAAPPADRDAVIEECKRAVWCANFGPAIVRPILAQLDALKSPKAKEGEE